MRNTIFILLVFALFVSCKQNKNISKTVDTSSNEMRETSNQPTVVYKTIRDFSDNVPVTMNYDRTKIISYPAPADLFQNGQLAKPTKLKNGYLLDNRGITENVVFLKYTYEEYSSLKTAPAVEDMIQNIREKYPLKEMYFCGSRNQFKNEVTDLNALIDAGFPNCKKADIISLGVTL